MADFLIQFFDNKQKNISSTVMLCNETEIHINIFDESENNGVSIFFNKSTAIKFAKTLRTEINKITEREGINE